MIKIMKYGEVSPEEIFARGTAATDVSGIVRDIIDNVKEKIKNQSGTRRKRLYRFYYRSSTRC